MGRFLKRECKTEILRNLGVFPAVVILGPRQCGKSTLVKMISSNLHDLLYLDLQNMDDLQKLESPTLFFDSNKDRTICLDEIQLYPNLFSVLRSVIDKNREKGKFILLGSASRDLIQKTSESLAGRVGFVELTPFLLQEITSQKEFDLKKYWLRGGFPDSYLAKTDDDAFLWCENYLRTYVERDIPQLGFQISSVQLRRFLTLCAHNSAQLFNSSNLGEHLGVAHTTIRRYLDLLEQTFLVKTLLPFESNTKKRLVKSPKIYLRDTGVLHRLLGIQDFNALLSHPIFGASWEGLVIENICSSFKDANFSFYRSASGNEIDLIIQLNQKTIAIECKASTAPKLSKGFWLALDDIKPDISFVAAPVEESYFLKENVMVANPMQIIQKIQHDPLF